MKTIKIMAIGIILAFLATILFSGNASAQILHVDSVMVDSVCNSDSLWYDGNGVLQQRISRDCNVSFIPQGEGMARMFIAMSEDSGNTWAPSPNPLTVLNNALSSTFMTGKKSKITVRVFSADRPGVAFKMTARQAAPILAGSPKVKTLGITATLTPGTNVGVAIDLRLASATQTDGFCTIAKIYWDAFGDGTIDDSTMGVNSLTWTWLTQVPMGATKQLRSVIAHAVDKNGLSSSPETLTVQFGIQLPIIMKNIVAGTFTMGVDSSVDGASPPHQVTLSAFSMQETDVTQEQYQAVMDTNPSNFKTGTDAPLRPVEQESWYDAAKFCNAISLINGLSTVYDTTKWTADFSKNGYRLPTEAQWEYACRAGSSTEYWWGPDTNGMGARIWWVGNSGNMPQPVATKLVNPFGLYDMTGNVWQWVNDWYEPYSSGSVTDPIGPATGTTHILRGGAWSDDFIIDHGFQTTCRIFDLPPSSKIWGGGFRVVLPQ